MRTLGLLLILPLLLVLCAVTTLWLPLPPSFPPPLSAGRNLLAAILTGLLGAGYLLGVGLYVVLAFRRAGHVLDSVLVPLGLTSRSHLLFGRRYQGQIEDRAVSVELVPARAVWPTQLNLYLAAHLGTRMAIGPRRPLLDCRHCTPLEHDVGLSGLRVVAQDRALAERLLGSTAWRRALVRLLGERRENEVRELILQPHSLWLHAHPRGLRKEEVLQWLEALLVLARVGERVLAGASGRGGADK